MENHLIRQRGPTAFALAPLLLVSQMAFAAVDVVRLDVSSGSLDEPLPFDVPFVVTGCAPAGTFRVRLQYEMASELFPDVPLESGVSADGEFRIEFPPSRRIVSSPSTLRSSEGCLGKALRSFATAWPASSITH